MSSIIETEASTNLINEETDDNALDKLNIPIEITEEITPTEKEWQDLLGSGSLMKKIIKEGDPDTRPQRLQKCTINLELSLEDDGTFIESKDKFEFQLGDCEVVQGLDVAIGLMNVNEKCRLKIQPRLGYGTKGLPPNIPGNATLVYEVELISVEPEKDPDTLTISERKIQGNKKRERGNWWYGRGENTLAIQCYRRALDFLDEVESGIDPMTKETEEEITDNALQNLLEDRISVCNNMAAAQIKLELYDAALNSLKTVLGCQPNNVKALFRKAKIYKAKNDLNTAMKCLKKANEVAPDNIDVQKEITAINQLIQKQNNREREVARRMFSNSNNKQNKHNNHLNNNLLKWGATLGLTFAVGLLSVAAYRLKFN